MIQPALLALIHPDDTGMQLLYFWAAVLLALTPILIFGTIGVWVARMIWKERREANAERGMGNAESQ
jgi:lauroyl/myristoyl acyltransferase